MRIKACLVLALLLQLCCLVTVAHAQDATDARELVWRRYDVELDVQQDGRILVTETQEVEFLSGSWRNGNRAIPLSRIEEIADVAVYQVEGANQRRLSLQQSETGGDLELDWRFPEAGTGDVRTFRLWYTVEGVVRVYPDNHQIRWIAVPRDRAFEVASSTVTLKLPGSVQPQNLVLASYPERLRANQEKLADGATWQVQDIGAYEEFEIRAQFPLGVVNASKPTWQDEADRRDYIRETVRPRNNIILLVLGLLILMSGVVGLIVLWRSRGIDPLVGPGPETLNQPPSELPAPVVGVLMDERVDDKDVLSALFSLAARGYVRISPSSRDGLFTEHFDHRLELVTSADESLQPYERLLLETLFREDSSLLLSDVGKKFGPLAARKFSKEMYEEATRAGLFRGNPEQVRRKYRLIRVGIMALGFLTFCAGITVGLGAVVTSRVDPPFVVIPGAALFVVGIGAIIVSFFMPAKTPTGAVAASQWRSFRNYLETYASTPSARSASRADAAPFHRYLPYAIALGLGPSWARNFKRASGTTPTWYASGIGYYPHGTATAGAPTDTAGFSGQGGSGMGSLDSMSNSFGDLLDQASSAFSSGFSSGGSGGGGFSGGGSGGSGGGSGGGSAGFS